MPDSAYGGLDPSAARLDVVIIGGGPAGLSAALNLGRARASVILVDAGRPRNAATLRSHGFLTRDGVLAARAAQARSRRARRLSERASCSIARVVSALLPTDSSDGMRFIAALQSRQAPDRRRRSRRAPSSSRPGLRETLPAIPSLRAFYGMTMFSCAACDAWELQDRALALIGETPDLADRARLIARWTDRLTVFTNGADVVDTVEEAELAASGIVVESGASTTSKATAARSRRCASPTARASRSTAGSCGPSGTLRSTSSRGSTPNATPKGTSSSTGPGARRSPGLYAAGDAAAPGPQQLIVAAGQGARVAAVLVHDLVGVRTAH